MKSEKISSNTHHGLVIPPHDNPQVAKLSRQARQRLNMLEHYAKHGSVALTCRHYGWGKTTFYKWLAEYKAEGLQGLEDRSKAPKNPSTRTIPEETVRIIIELRKKNPEELLSIN